MKKLMTYMAAMLFCTLLSTDVFSRQGSFIIDDHYRSSEHRDGIHFEIISDQNGLISVAHNQGVYQYDGTVWDYYHTPTAAISLTNDADNSIYVGCVNGFGRLDWVDYKIEYIPVYESENTPELFFQVETAGDHVYFLSEKSLFIYKISEKKIVKSFSEKFLNLYLLGSKVFVNTENSTFRIDNLELKNINIPEETGLIASVVNSRKTKPTFAVNFNGKLFRYEKDTFSPLSINDLIEERELAITDIQLVNDTLLAAATLDDGCLFLNIKSDEIEVLDHFKGLADNEIFAIHTDVEGGLWVSHELGLSRILASFPARSYSHLPGLAGNLLSVQRTEERLWLTSSAGIFYFDQDTTFQNKVYYVVRDAAREPETKKRKSTSRKRVAQPEKAEQAEEEKVESKSSRKKKKKGLFNRLFNKKKNILEEQEQEKNKDTITAANEKTEEKEEEKVGFFKKIFGGQTENDEKTVDKVSGKLRTDKIYLRRTRKIPTGITHKYAKVTGSEGKTSELIQFNEHLLAISSSGLFELTGDSAHLVIDEPIDVAIHLEGTNELMVLTYDQRIKLFALTDNIWIEKKAFDPSDIINDIYQDKDGTVWLAGSSEIFHVAVENDEILIKNEYEIDNYRFDHILMTSINDTTFFINTHGYFYLDKQADQLRPYQQWLNKIGKPLNYFRDSQNFLWIYNGKTWYEVSELGTMVVHRYFGLFPGLRMITYDQVLDKYWLITGKNKLLAFDHTAESIDSTLHPLFLKKIKALNGVLQARDKLMINYDNTYLSFEMSKPDYLGLLNTEYQYKLEGMNDNWSEWSANSKIDFSFLQPGKYTLHVMSRDSFGNLEEAEPISFTVKTPYWQTPWFYALQVILFGSLVLLSSKLNQTNTRNRFLKSALTILTLVLIIEFLQSAMASYLNIKSTPVVDFLIDVGTALLVFPVEKFLRGFLMEGKTGFNFKLFRKKQSSSKVATGTE